MASTIDGASSSSSSSPSFRTTRWVNHVFLSFRGDDTRRTFTDHLFASLDKRGIKTFRDDHDLQRGELISHELMKAIEESMFALIILSPNYASSSWCLDELLKILHCKKTFGQAVFPIFYGVDPSDVRHQRGTFALAFSEHEEKFKEDRKKVERWRNALREVASFSGWDSKNQHEVALIEAIVGDIQKKLIPKLPSWKDNLVAIDSRIKEVNSLIGMRLNDVRFIGICGMGGIGKTTIARLVYEAIKEEFNVSCFLADIREVSKAKGLVHIQRELLFRLNIRSSDFHDCHDGTKIIANFLRNKKVLLVLDDVSELSQLENLVGKQEWFGPGSRIIITTRDKHLLVTHGVDKTWNARGLVQKEALKLFCWKAFKQDHPEEKYLDLCKEVVEYTRGLPLALEVLGSHLHGRTVEVWHSAIKQIKSVPHSKILDSLKISFDSLQPVEKNLFLDIACFFKGMDKDEVIGLLENCGDHPQIGIDILIEKCLINLDRMNNKLGMHDLLQEMGKNIVFQESPNDPGRRSRLWSQKDIDHVLTKNKGTDEIQSMVLNLVEPCKARWKAEAFSKTSQLRLLKLCEMQLPLGLNCLPSALKVLHWKGFPLKTLPLTNNELDAVVDIKLSHSRIEQLWHGTKFLEDLKFIDLSFSKNLKQTPDFVGVPNLESLILEGCTSLTEVHPSVVHRKKLVVMNLKDCKRLKALPCKMEMSSLKNLNLSGCSEFRYLPEFGQSMENLSEFSLEGTAITKLPSSLGCLLGLNHLDLMNCKNLIFLPDTIRKLKSLITLDVSGCSKLRILPEGLKEIKCLEVLCASDTAIEELPSFVFYLENLKEISFAGCKGPVSKSVNMFLHPFKRLFGSHEAPSGFQLPSSILSLPSLRRLNLSYCNLSEESLPNGFFQLSSLMTLDLTGNNFVSLPSSISKLPKLQYLRLNWCNKLQRLPELPSSMRGLDASNCDSLEASVIDPSKPCSLFATPTEWYLPKELRIFLKERLPKERFDMVITGSEIPSWFVPQKCVSFAKISVPRNCPLAEWVGFALCFLLVDNAWEPDDCHHEIELYLFGPNGKRFITSRNLPPMEPWYPHLYILYLSIDKFRDSINDGEENSEIEFVLKCYCCHSLQIVRCGSRLVCKQDVEDIFRNHS